MRPFVSPTARIRSSSWSMLSSTSSTVSPSKIRAASGKSILCFVRFVRRLAGSQSKAISYIDVCQYKCQYGSTTGVAAQEGAAGSRDRLNLDISGLEDESLEDASNLLPPEATAAETVEDLE